jgi:lipoate-protein ligase A
MQQPKTTICHPSFVIYTMLCISQHITDPYFNIASEEYLLKNFSDDIFMLYQNEPSIIVGKHQNAFAEVNYWFSKKNGITVVRRLSGGGTVFHDMGNLNFTFIQNGKEGSLIDFKRFTEPILQVLRNLGVPADRSGRNDLIIEGLKFSGNAEHVYKNRTLHHGTLLFSSKLDSLGEALRVNPDHYQDKAVKSVRSRVTNITDHLPIPLSLSEFRETIVNHAYSILPKVTPYQFSTSDVTQIEKLVTEKYATWDWNYGYSPRFIVQKNGTVNKNPVLIILEIEKGIIGQAKVEINNERARLLEEDICNQYYKEDIIKKIISRFFTEPDTESFLKLLF